MGRLTYFRQIPAELRPYLGGKASIRRSLGPAATDISDASVLSAYSRVHSEVEALIADAKQRQAHGSALMAVDTEAIRPGLEQFPLSKRDVAGIAGQVLLDIREAVANQQSMSAEFTQSLVALAIKAKNKGISGISVADFAVLAKPALNSLGISPSPADMEAIGQALLGYLPIIQADMGKLADMDYSPPRLAEVAPPMPKRQATWRDLFDAWLASTGGVLEQDGYGVHSDRQGPYRTAIAEFTEHITDVSPTSVTPEQAQDYLRWLQEDSAKSVRTQQGRLTCIRNLLRIGVSKGLISSNPFDVVVLKTPAGIEDTKGYRPFTKSELKVIFKAIKEELTVDRRLMPWILLCTGCRLAEAFQLRTKDIKRTDTGVWYIDWQHEPLGQYPMFLKTKAKNNRQCPIHPALIEQGFLKLPRKNEGLLLPGPSYSSATWSQWFTRLLRQIGMYEKRKTSLHSLRGTAKDLQREAGISLDVRHALTGHSSKDVGESSYGKGLRMMPDVLAKELIKVDLSWLE